MKLITVNGKGDLITIPLTFNTLFSYLKEPWWEFWVETGKSARFNKEEFYEWAIKNKKCPLLMKDDG